MARNWLLGMGVVVAFLHISCGPSPTVERVAQAEPVEQAVQAESEPRSAEDVAQTPKEKPDRQRKRFTATSTRNAAWAVPLQVPGLPNLHKVSDSLYRGAQPTAEGMRRLKAMGIRTVVNLRSFHSDRDEIGDTGLAYEHIYMKAWHPEDKEVVRFLQIVSDENRTPVFAHCQHGADRTGTMCSIYRIAVQGWTVEDAVTEMTQGGFGFHGVWQNLIAYIRDLDIDRIKRRAGLTK